MRHITSLLFTVTLPFAASAQVQNGSFEDAGGTFDLSYWQYTCSGTSPLPGPAAPGFGNTGVLVPHSNSFSCGNSKLYQTLPTVHDGEVYTLSGWCCNFLWMIADPYIGFLMGSKSSSGTFTTYVGPVMNTGSWTYLSVTDTFHLAVGDTALVMCDAGTVSGSGGTPTYGTFDGILLEPAFPTAIATTTSSLPWRYDPMTQHMLVHFPEGDASDLALFDATGRSHAMKASRNGTTLSVDMSADNEGIYLLRIGARVIRFAKH